ASSQRRFQGVITGFSQIDSARDVTTYELVLESHLAQLGLGSHCRLFIDQGIPDIIAQVLDDKGFTSDTHYYRFTLYRSYPRLPTVMQWQESDLAFIQRLCRRCGIWFRMAEGEFGEQIVFADDFTHYQRQPALSAPFKAHAGLESIGAEAVFALETHTKTIPASVFVRDYNRLAAPACIDEEHALRTQDRTAFGQVYRWGSLHLDAEQAEWEAQLRHEALLCEQVVYHGRGNVLGLAPGSVFNLSGKSLPDAEHGQLITRVEHAGARDAAYTNRYTAIPSDRLYRLPLEEDNWPRIGGTVSARIVSPDRYPYAYLNQDGDYRVQFDFDREERQSGHSSCWLRLAKPFAGALQTGFHFPLIEGTEVAIAFHNGHPDAPYIAHALHDSHNSDLITHRDRWMSRNEIRTQSNNKLRLEDWQGQEHIKLATEHGKSQLNLGHLVNASKEPRGEGLELRTDGWGSVRAGKGLLLSADAQPKALGKQLDMREANAQLNAALNLSQALADATKAAQAHIAEVSEQKQLLDQRIKELKQAVLLASAPAGMALTSGQHLQVSAQNNLIVTAGGHADISVFRKFTIAAGEAISLCAHKLGMKLFA
ncbi:type VI secretion system tip protein VgrG, partial [Herbaspirillum lusitanum]